MIRVGGRSYPGSVKGDKDCGNCQLMGSDGSDGKHFGGRRDRAPDG